jgi:outer membrane protein
MHGSKGLTTTSRRSGAGREGAHPRPASRKRARALAFPGAICLVMLASAGAAQDQDLAVQRHDVSPQAHGPLLTLTQALEFARANHPKLARERAAVAQARAREQIAWSRYFPGITAEFSYAPETPNYVPSPAFRRVLERREAGGVGSVRDVDGNVIPVSCAGVTKEPGCDESPASPLPPRSYKLYDFWTARVGIAWTLFDWGSTTYATRAARTLVLAREEGVQATLAEIVLETKLAYYDVLAAEAAVAVAEEELAARQRHAQSAQVLQAAGRGTGVDVASAEAAVASAELLLVRAQGGVTFARAVLAVLTGREDVRERPLAVPEALHASADVPSEQTLAKSTEDRPELRELSLEAKAMRELAESARAAYLPQIQLHAGPSWSGGALDELIPNFGAMIGLRFPGQQGMNPVQVAGNVKEAAARAASLRAQREVLRNELRMQAESARIELLTARQALLAARKVVDTARKRRDQAELRYRQGVGSFLDLSDAELAFTNARFEAVRAAFDVGRAQSRLERALGAR